MIVSISIGFQSFDEFIDVSNAKDSSFGPNLDGSSDSVHGGSIRFATNKDQGLSQYRRKGL